VAALKDELLDQLGARGLVLDQHDSRIEQFLLLNIRRRTTCNRRSKSLRSIACPRYRSVLDINRCRKAVASQRIIQLHSDRGTIYRVPGRAYAPRGGYWAHRAERSSSSLHDSGEKRADGNY
jgi:hypothetical protein